MSPVRTASGTNDIPPATRGTRPGWRDPRLWTGVALVVCSVVLGARVVGAADDTVTMWAVRSDKAPGEVITPGDLVTTRVRFEEQADAAKYFTAADTLPTSRHLVRPVGAGELLPRAGLGDADPDTVRVSVAVPAAHLPPGVGPGSRVDLWVAPAGTGEGRAERAARDVVVLEVPAVQAELGAAGGERQVVLSVPDRGTTLAEVLTASGGGRLMVVGRG